MFFLRRINGGRAPEFRGLAAPAFPVRAGPLADIGGNTALNLPIAYRKALAGRRRLASLRPWPACDKPGFPIDPISRSISYESITPYQNILCIGRGARAGLQRLGVAGGNLVIRRYGRYPVEK